MLYELKTQLGYQIRYFQLDDDPDDPCISVAVQPNFDGYNREGDECTVFDSLMLAEKMNEDACYYPITCECGMPDDAAINAPITQKITDSEIHWDIPIEDYRWTISPEYKEKKGTLRLIFDKQHFQQTVLQMNTELQLLVKTGIEIATIKPERFIKLYSGAHFLEDLRSSIADNPQITHAKVWEVYPYGGEEAAALFID